jgi:malate permease and related proteins
LFRVLLDVVAPVLIVAFIGGVVGRKVGMATETMSRAVFYLFSPALVFTSLSSIKAGSGDVARLVSIAVGVFAMNAVVSTLWGRLRHHDRPTRATSLLSNSVVNHGNMGLPMARLAFGEAGLQLAVVIFVTGVVLWATVGIMLANAVAGRGTWRTSLRAPLKYPSIYAAALGVLVNATNVHLPTFITDSTKSLGQASIPCMLVVLGLQFRRPDVRQLFEPGAVAVNRLLLGPLTAWGLAAAIGLDGTPAKIAILLCGMPTAVMTTILARELDGKPELAVNTVLVTTLASIGSLTVLITLLR